jgi:tagatose-6-phosphate ketose/aldose isomerase
MALAAYAVLSSDEHQPAIDFIGGLADSVQADMSYMDTLARQIAGFDYNRLVYLGSGGLKGLTREGAIKSMELTNGEVIAVSESSMGFRHGPKTMLKPQTLSVHFVSPDKFTATYDMDVVNEIVREKNGNRVLVLEPRQMPLPDGVDYAFRYAAPEARYANMSAYINCLMFLQILSLEKSIALGATTDNPSVGGEVSRVVHGVTIYNRESKKC